MRKTECRIAEESCHAIVQKTYDAGSCFGEGCSEEPAKINVDCNQYIKEENLEFARNRLILQAEGEFEINNNLGISGYESSYILYDNQLPIVTENIKVGIPTLFNGVEYINCFFL